MPAKIFYKERRKIRDGEKKPRFRMVAVLDCNLKVYADHLRLSELEHIAEEADAELIWQGSRKYYPRPKRGACGYDYIQTITKGSI